MKKKDRKRAKKALFDAIETVANAREIDCTATEKLYAIAAAARALKKL